MKEIPLTRGKIALVDDEDFEWLDSFKWHAHQCISSKHLFYAYNRNYKNRPPDHLKMHQMIMKPTKGLQIDHIDGNGLNNQKSNLRLVTPRMNCQNLHIPTSNKFPGVQKYQKNLVKPFRAKIRFNGKQRHIGFFETEEEASIAYRVACACLDSHNTPLELIAEGVVPA